MYHLLFADTGTEDIIPLPNVPGKILAKVIEYCKFHVEANKKVDDKPAKSEDDIKQWDTDFVKVDQATLFDLILVREAAGMLALLLLLLVLLAQHVLLVLQALLLVMLPLSCVQCLIWAAMQLQQLVNCRSEA